jgi:tetratricopeptide (TPR) repeat protein
VLDTLQKNIPPTDPRVAQALANLATVYLLQARYGEAERLYKQALDITMKALGPSNAAVATLISNLADVYKNQARYDEAEAQYKRALDMAEKAGGPNSLEVARVLNNLTKVYEESKPVWRGGGGQQKGACDPRAGARPQPSRRGSKPQQPGSRI